MEGRPLLTSKQRTEVVCGVPTQVVCTAFSSHILVVVTQFGKMGTLVSLEPSAVASDVGKPVLTTRVLLGQDEVEWVEGGGPHAATSAAVGAPACPPAPFPSPAGFVQQAGGRMDFVGFDPRGVAWSPSSE